MLGPQHEPHEDLPVAGGVFLVWIHFGIKVIYKSINKNPLNVTSYDMNPIRIIIATSRQTTMYRPLEYLLLYI